MNRATTRFFLLTMPTAVVVTWGFLSRAADVPFALLNATLFAVVLAIGTAARPAVPLRTLAATAAVGGVFSAVLGLPLATFAMLPPGVSYFSFGYDGWEGVPPALVWSIMAVIVAGGGALICMVAVVLGRLARLRLERGEPS